MLLNLKERCPVCENKIPIYIHLFFKEFVGLQCPLCKSLLSHSGKTKIIKYALLLIFIVLFGSWLGLSENLWVGLEAFLSLIVLVSVQLKAKFVVKDERNDFV